MYTKLRGFTLIELLVALSIVALVGAIIIGGCSGCNRSTGFRVGTIQKAGDSGWVFSTHEMEVATEGIAKTASGMTSIWYVTVYDDDLWKKIQDLPVDKKLKFYYKHHRWVWSWNGETKYEVYKVESVGGPEKTG